MRERDEDRKPFRHAGRGAPRHGGPPDRDRGRRDRDHGRPHRRGRERSRDGDGTATLYGWHTVTAALENPQRRFHRLLATENALHRLREAGVRPPIEPELVRPEAIDTMLEPDAVHQGLLAEADPLPSPDIAELAPEGVVLVLDQITDPHNVGAILRTAAAFAVRAVITTARHSPQASGVLAKAASGALEYVPVVTVPNLARALRELKEADWFVVGLDSAGETDLGAAPIRAPLALVLGAEGRGIRHLTRETCDTVARLDLPGRIKSLNVSNATVLALHIATGRLGQA
jgi:23S rRNA (guanosine2251-2'-O)-methyltransferase